MLCILSHRSEAAQSVKKVMMGGGSPDQGAGAEGPAI